MQEQDTFNYQPEIGARDTEEGPVDGLSYGNTSHERRRNDDDDDDDDNNTNNSNNVGDNDDQLVETGKSSLELTANRENDTSDHEAVIITDDDGSSMTEEEESRSVGSSYLGSEGELKLLEEEEEVEEETSEKSLTESSEEEVGEESTETHTHAAADGTKISTKRRLHENSDEEDTGAVSIKPPLSKHEVAYQELPVEPLSIEIPPEATIINIGFIQSIVDDLVVIQSTVDGRQALDVDSVLCFEDRTVLGRVFETFGPIRQPLYSVRLPSSESVPKEWVLLRKTVYSVPDYCQFVHIQHLKRLKGCDASDRYDEELPEEHQEFSDDEKEAGSKRKKNRPDRQVPTNKTAIEVSKDPSSHTTSEKMMSMPSSFTHARRPVISYDDIDDRNAEEQDTPDDIQPKPGVVFNARLRVRPSSSSRENTSLQQRSRPTNPPPQHPRPRHYVPNRTIQATRGPPPNHLAPPSNYNDYLNRVNSNLNDPAVAALAAAIVQAASESGHPPQQYPPPMHLYSTGIPHHPYPYIQAASTSHQEYSNHQVPSHGTHFQSYMLYPPASGYDPSTRPPHFQPPTSYPDPKAYYPAPGYYNTY